MAYKLTATGEGRALRVAQIEGPEDAVIAFMYDVSKASDNPVELEEILDETHMDDSTALKVMEKLVGRGHVKEV
jgi:hypothetical protein